MSEVEEVESALETSARDGMASPCRVDVLFHYFLEERSDLAESVLGTGLRPLSDFPESERWNAINTSHPGFFRELYALFAAPVLGDLAPPSSGIFLTPIDFRSIPGSPMARKRRLRIGLDRIDPSLACLTYELDGSRRSFPLTRGTLAETEGLWTSEHVVEWFGRDPERLFWYVPQVVTYQRRIEISLSDLE